MFNFKELYFSTGFETIFINVLSESVNLLYYREAIVLDGIIIVRLDKGLFHSTFSELQESEIAAVTLGAARSPKPMMSLTALLSPQDRPGSAPPSGSGRRGVSTRDAGVQSEAKDDEEADNVSDVNSVHSARSQPDDIKVVSFNSAAVQFPSAQSTRSLDGGERTSYRAAAAFGANQLNQRPPTAQPPNSQRPPSTQSHRGGVRRNQYHNGFERLVGDSEEATWRGPPGGQRPNQNGGAKKRSPRGPEVNGRGNYRGGGWNNNS